MRGIKYALPFFFSLLSGLFPLQGVSMNEFSLLIPKQSGAWETDGEDAVYNRETLYDYMDGGAEVYLAFGFREVFSRNYKNHGGVRITLDIYDMGSGAEAFGIFSSDRVDPEACIGQDSEYGFGLLRFWNGRFYVTVTAAADDEETEKAILELGRSVLPHLGDAGERPTLVSSIPKKDLVENRTSYFHSNVNLNNRFFIASENILHLGPETDCVLAEYATGSAENAVLLLIQYPEEAAARSAFNSFIRAYLPEADKNGRGLTEKKKWVSAKTKGKALSILFDSPSAGWADEFESALEISDQ